MTCRINENLPISNQVRRPRTTTLQAQPWQNHPTWWWKFIWKGETSFILGLVDDDLPFKRLLDSRRGPTGNHIVYNSTQEYSCLLLLFFFCSRLNLTGQLSNPTTFSCQKMYKVSHIGWKGERNIFYKGVETSH